MYPTYSYVNVSSFSYNCILHIAMLIFRTYSYVNVFKYLTSESVISNMQAAVLLTVIFTANAPWEHVYYYHSPHYNYEYYRSWFRSPGIVDKAVERGRQVGEIGGLVLSRVKPMTYNIDTCHFLAWREALLGYGKDWLGQCQDNVTEWDIGQWYWQPDFPVGQHDKSPWMCTVTSRYPSWYDFRCSQDVKLQKPTTCCSASMALVNLPRKRCPLPGIHQPYLYAPTQGSRVCGFTS